MNLKAFVVAAIDAEKSTPTVAVSVLLIGSDPIDNAPVTVTPVFVVSNFLELLYINSTPAAGVNLASSSVP